jgi:large subunit ribosomal protein L1
MANKKEKATTKHVSRKARMQEVEKLLTKSSYSVAEAAALLPKLSLSKFAGSATLDVVLSLKDKQANESVRGSVVFPNSFGEEKRVLVLAEPDKQRDAAGADFVGLDDLVEKISGGWLEFDVVIATPAVMPKIARLGKILGPRQLMPNPKTGTVTEKLEQAVKMYKSGKIDFKMDGQKTIKLRFAKLDMTPEQIEQNLNAAIEAIKNEIRRLGAEALRKMIVSPTMGPSIVIS